MAHLWIRWQKYRGDEREPGQPEWAVVPLEGDAGVFILTDDPSRPVRLGGRARNGSGVAEILRVEGRQSETYILQSPEREGVRVNGLPLVAGFRVLDDRDEIRMTRTGRIYFSTESSPRVEPFREGQEAAQCPRCKGRIAEGDLSVQCPKCRTWHHERSDLGCWTYTDSCALCDQPTRLDAGFRWTPRGL